MVLQGADRLSYSIAVTNRDTWQHLIGLLRRNRCGPFRQWYGRYELPHLPALSTGQTANPRLLLWDFELSNEGGEFRLPRQGDMETR